MIHDPRSPHADHLDPDAEIRTPSLSALPSPPPGRIGWPWTITTPQLHPTMPDGGPWPRISVVTPSYNQGRFVEEAIRSVLLQGYPNLEYIVIDGGSTDESVEIISRYEPWITHWISERDGGAAHALNKGLSQCTGSISAWLNSDDVYRPGALQSVQAAFASNPDADVISGVSRLVSASGVDEFIGPSPLRTLLDFCKIASNWTSKKLILQPEAFFKRSLYATIGPIREDLDFCYDVMFWISAASRGSKFYSVSQHFADFRLHPSQKTSNLNLAYQELARAVFDFCRNNKIVSPAQFAIISDEIICLLERIITQERRRAQILEQSRSYKIGRVVTRAKFW